MFSIVKDSLAVSPRYTSPRSRLRQRGGDVCWREREKKHVSKVSNSVGVGWAYRRGGQRALVTLIPSLFHPVLAAQHSLPAFIRVVPSSHQLQACRALPVLIHVEGWRNASAHQGDLDRAVLALEVEDLSMLACPLWTVCKQQTVALLGCGGAAADAQWGADGERRSTLSNSRPMATGK